MTFTRWINTTGGYVSAESRSTASGMQANRERPSAEQSSPLRVGICVMCGILQKGIDGNSRIVQLTFKLSMPVHILL